MVGVTTPIAIVGSESLLVRTARELASRHPASAGLDRAVLTDCRFDRCDLANVHLPEATVTRVALHEARLTGAQWVNGAAADVTFDGCRLDLAGFRFTRMRRVLFRGCVLARADF